VKTFYFLKTFIVLALLVAFTACEDNNHFSVKGTIIEGSTENLKVAYYGNNAYHSGSAPAREGKFEFGGDADQPTIVDIYSHDGRLVGQIYVANGDKLEITISLENPYNITVTGNETSTEWADFIRKNAETFKSRNSLAINDAIEGYVTQNPTKISSTLLLVTSFDASTDPDKAEKLLKSIAPEARPGSITDSYKVLLNRVASAASKAKVLPLTFLSAHDSLTTFNPKRSQVSLLTFSTNTDRNDSIVETLKLLNKKYNARTLRIVDFSLDPDTITWKRSIRTDSATWTQGWAPGFITARGIDRLGLPRVPFYIVSDSTGRQIYRGASLDDAAETIKKTTGK
jgi:hypothetical protein